MNQINECDSLCCYHRVLRTRHITGCTQCNGGKCQVHKNSNNQSDEESYDEFDKDDRVGKNDFEPAVIIENII